jgi:quercetin dioxygenase-like cupin family protein
VIRALTALACAMLLSPVARGFQPRDRGPERAARQEPERTTVLANATVAVMRQRLAPGARETIRANGLPLLVVHPTRGPVFVAGGGEYAALNDEAAPIDLLLVAIKPDRPSAPAAPPTEAPAGITRTTLIDNADVRVVRVRFAPGSREPIHTHPNDLLTVQLTPGTFDIVVGETRTSGRQTAGFTKFLPRDVSHAYISTDSSPFELLSISIK